MVAVDSVGSSDTNRHCESCYKVRFINSPSNHTSTPKVQPAQVRPVLSPQTACVAIFQADEQWYDAKVVNPTENGYLVSFNDFEFECEVAVFDMQPVRDCFSGRQ